MALRRQKDDRHPDILQLKSPKSPSATALEQGRPVGGLQKSVKQERNCHQQREHVPFGGEGGLGPRSGPNLAGLEMETEILQGLYWGFNCTEPLGWSGVNTKPNVCCSGQAGADEPTRVCYGLFTHLEARGQGCHLSSHCPPMTPASATHVRGSQRRQEDRLRAQSAVLICGVHLLRKTICRSLQMYETQGDRHALEKQYLF